jgi:hypothetical protein
VTKARKTKKNRKLSKPVRAALERGDIVPESALRGKKVPKSVRAAFMKASMEKAADKRSPYDHRLYDPRLHMLRKGDSFPGRETPGSVHTAIDQLMAETVMVLKAEAANRKLPEPEKATYAHLFTNPYGRA